MRQKAPTLGNTSKLDIVREAEQWHGLGQTLKKPEYHKNETSQTSVSDEYARCVATLVRPPIDRRGI
jgi:hypothetical protein